MSASIQLTTAAEVKTYLGLSGSTQDARLTALITLASQAFEKYCHREFILKARDEYLDGLGDRKLVLRQRPIDRSATLTIVVNTDIPRDYTDASDALETSEYTVDYVAGIITYTGTFPAGDETVKVTYTAGLAAATASLPDDLRFAAVLAVAALYNRAKQGGDGISTERLDAWLQATSIHA